MNFTFWLVLFLSIDPSPTFMVLDEMDTLEKCNKIVTMIKADPKLLPEQRNGLGCLPIAVGATGRGT